MARDISPETVRELARMAGIEIDEERLQQTADRLAEMYGFLDELDELPLGEIAPAGAFVPAWPEERRG